jgi:hypothetical protein
MQVMQAATRTRRVAEQISFDAPGAGGRRLCINAPPSADSDQGARWKSGLPDFVQDFGTQPQPSAASFEFR